MPITTSVPIAVLDQESFHEVDRIATGCAFDIHNELGRYLDEPLYQAELAARLSDHKLSVAREMKISLSLDDYARDYYVDLLVDGGVIIETKAVEALVPAHRAQTLNYLYLCGLSHATLLNFRPERVEHEFVSTRLTPASRRRLSWNLDQWKPLTKRCKILHASLVRVLAEWGSGLDPALYRDALTHFLGGEAKVIRAVEVVSAKRSIGAQSVHHLTSDVAFSVTASLHRPAAVLEHQHRFLRHTRLRAIQWVNLNRQAVTLCTIQR